MPRVVYVSAPVRIKIEDGLAKITTRSGDESLESVMCLHDLLAGYEETRRAIAEWQARGGAVLLRLGHSVKVIRRDASLRLLHNLRHQSPRWQRRAIGGAGHGRNRNTHRLGEGGGGMTRLAEIIGERHGSHLRHTQTDVKSVFARGALRPVCEPRNTDDVKVALQEAREAQGLRLEDIAEEIGVAISTVQRWEKGVIDIPSSRFPAIAKAYRIDIGRLVEGGKEVDAAEVIDIWSRIPLGDRGQAVKVFRTFAKD
jgi:transcriptional regulator with XRE-family HTH domain